MASKGAGKEKVDTDEVLQAVVIAESFNQRFQPLTANKPRVRFISVHSIFY
jgi:translation initiation factor eIF-2B subunit epsilon